MIVLQGTSRNGIEMWDEYIDDTPKPIETYIRKRKDEWFYVGNDNIYLIKVDNTIKSFENMRSFYIKFKADSDAKKT